MSLSNGAAYSRCQEEGTFFDYLIQYGLSDILDRKIEAGKEDL